MVVGLGCEKLTVDKLLLQDEISPQNIIILQEEHGFEGMVSSIMKMAENS